MKINSSEFIKSAPDLANCPADGRREIAFVGRSNVGKSSLINYLINRKKLARTSSAPGRTQMLNYYLINDKTYFVDLPGYGYAKVSQTMRRQWRGLMVDYICNRNTLAGVIQVVDIRHPPSKEDSWMAENLKHCGAVQIVVATKADKISKSKRRNHLSVIAKELNYPVDKIFVISSTKREGKDQLLSEISNILT